MLCILPLVASCGHSENRYLKRTVKAAELVGDYRGTPFAMESLKYAGYRQHLDPADHRLALRSDGSCDVQTVADPTIPGPDGAGLWLAAGAPCRWELASGGHQTVRIAVSAQTLSFYLDEEYGRLVLWQFVSDPDGWKYMELAKVAVDAG